MGQPPRPMPEDKQLVNLGRILQILREEENVDVLLETTLTYIQAESDYSLIWIGFYDRLDHRILGKGGITPTGDPAFLKQRFFLNPGDLLEQVVIQQRPIGVPDLQQETRAGAWRRAAQNFNIRGTLIFPIRYRDRCFGVMLLGSTQWGVSPRSDEKARLSMLLGGLAAALNQIETDWQRQQTKRPEEPLLALLQELRSLPTMWQRLEAVVAQTHEFVKPTRTNIYWFEPERRYFWRRVSNRATGNFAPKDSTPGITVQEAGGFYKAMVADQLVSIGEAHSSLKADVTSRLLQRLGVRSLLAAPIVLQDELLGFLAVEGNDPRIWKEEEKHYIRGAAQLVALVAPIEQMEATIEQTKQDQVLTAELARAIATAEDWETTLKTCAEHLHARLQQSRFLVLLFDPDQNKFEICYQSHPVNRHHLGESEARSGPGDTGANSPTLSLTALSEVDWQWLERSKEAVEIEDLTADLKLMAWRDGFLEAGVRSLLLCSTNLGHSLEGMLILGYETPRTWTGVERELVRVVSQQLGLILHQWRLQKQVLFQQKTFQSLQWGLTTLSSTQLTSEFDPQGYAQAIVQPITQMLACPLAALVTWFPGEQVGRIIPAIALGSHFNINPEIAVPIETDELIQAALLADGLVAKTVDDLSPGTRQWLCGDRIGEILVMALRTAPEHEPTAVVIVADQRGRHWPESALPAFGLLMQELAWLRRYSLLTTHLQSQKQELERLNWYKHRYLEDFHRYVETGVKLLSQLLETGELPSLQEGRVRQINQQLGNSLTGISQMLESEMWNMRPLSDLSDRPEDTISLTTLLKRNLERVDPLLKQRRLWSQVHEAKSEHNLKTPLKFGGELLKIELVLYEVFVAACCRAPEGGRIDIWYRIIPLGDSPSSANLNQFPLCDRLLELSITDNGVIDSQLLAELKHHPDDELMPSTLDRPPGLHLWICQSLIQQIGGQLKLYQIEDGRVLSRLLIPIAKA